MRVVCRRKVRNLLGCMFFIAIPTYVIVYLNLKDRISHRRELTSNNFSDYRSHPSSESLKMAVRTRDRISHRREVTSDNFSDFTGVPSSESLKTTVRTKDRISHLREVTSGNRSVPSTESLKMAVSTKDLVNLTNQKSDQNDTKVISDSLNVDPSQSFKPCAYNVSDGEFRRFYPCKFEYPLNTDMPDLLKRLKRNENVSENPIFPYPYTFTKSSSVCNSKAVFLLILVKSAVSHSKKRDIIRNTWGSYGSSEVTVLFLLGSTNSNSRQIKIFKENKLHKDIIQATFIDNYYNNTLKTVGGIKWASQYCNNSKYVLFADDDFYIAMDTLLKYIKRIPKNKRHTLYRGATWRDAQPERDPKSKWYISRQDYRYDRYPDFVAAGFMLMSMEVVLNMNLVIPYTKYFIFDDVYIAIVAYKLKISPKSMVDVHVLKYPYKQKGFGQVIASHGYDTERSMVRAWMKHLSSIKSLLLRNHHNHV